MSSPQPKQVLATIDSLIAAKDETIKALRSISTTDEFIYDALKCLALQNERIEACKKELAELAELAVTDTAYKKELALHDELNTLAETLHGRAAQDELLEAYTLAAKHELVDASRKQVAHKGKLITTYEKKIALLAAKGAEPPAKRARTSE
jgi:hypothetical protein